MDHRGDATFQTALATYCSILCAIGDSGVEACPPVGSTLRDNLGALKNELEEQPTEHQIVETNGRVELELKQWGVDTAAYFRQRANEAKELMLILARTAEVMGERDHRYTTQLHDFTSRLHSIADLEDLAEIRDSLVRSAIDLKACAEAMAHESEKAVARLHEDVNTCQARLGDARRLAETDPLTGLGNRRAVENAIQERIAEGGPFSVMVMDLNGFKRINDVYGHLAGDDILKRFADELRSAFRASDVVGRWGGDEFIVMLDGGPQDAIGYLERMKRSVFGQYPISIGGQTRKVAIDAAVGIAGWRKGENLRTLIDRADAAMYSSKRGSAMARA